MIQRRHFLYAATLLSAAVALSVTAHLARAQQTYGNAEVKISELRPVLEQYFDHLSQVYKENTGVAFSPEEKKQMVEDTISKMKKRQFYTYVDP
jgi:hypothetical protein